VRDAWREVARDPTVNPAPAQVIPMPRHRDAGFSDDAYGAEAPAAGARWNA
jgi:hypothetical protein